MAGHYDERTGLEIIPLAECAQLLHSRQVGRLGMIVNDKPQIFPVNYVWDGEAVIFRTDAGTKLESIVGADVVFETDKLSLADRSGWSVIVEGVAEVIDPGADPATLDRLKRLGLFPWAAGDKSTWVRIPAGKVSGRRVRRSPS